MITAFTENDLVRFLYEEVNEDERLDIKEVLNADMELQSIMDELKEAKLLLENFSLKVSKNVVSRILSASKNLQFEY